VLSVTLAARGQPASNTQEPRASLVARSKVWLPTDIPSKNLLTGPSGPGAFALDATVECTYREKNFHGKSPKFACELPNGKMLKVKYGRNNGEVFGEVAATRLLWALGFGADSMYSVRVACRGCPPSIGVSEPGRDVRIVDPAAVEKKMPHRLSERWSWKELDEIDERAGGATRAERDAFTLLAVLIQHGDSKPVQQRIVCVSFDEDGRCAVPLVMIQDLGNTFAHAATFSGNQRLSANFVRWTRQRIWKDPARCVGNLSGVFTSTLHNPVISEEGRRLLANLLEQLSDQQLHDMFAAARIDLRKRAPESGQPDLSSIDEWVDAFKQKRSEIVDHHCPK
jgi:hypothetical protein